VSIDDRIRAATEAVAATVREIPPLPLPPDFAPAGAEPGRPRRSRPARPARRSRRAWGSWLVPLAAAAAVIAVAAVLVAVRSLPGAGHASGAATAGPGRAFAGLPRYGVALAIGKTRQSGGGSIAPSGLSVIDTWTGKQVASVQPPANLTFTGVSGAADDRTFAVTAQYTIPVPVPGSTTGDTEAIHVWYLLRIAPGSAQPVKLTRLRIPALLSAAVINGLALSPDGRTLAVLQWPEGSMGLGLPPAPSATLTLYSVATGKALRTWTGGPPPAIMPGTGAFNLPVENYAGLTWLPGGRTLAFTYYAGGQARTVRTLDTARPGNDLVAGSRSVFTVPSSGPDACDEAVLTPDARTVLCDIQSHPAGRNCAQTLQIAAYSPVTGKRERVLYRHTGECATDGIGALGWVGPGDTVVATVDAGIVINGSFFDGTNVIVGVLTGGKVIPLLEGTVRFAQGPGTIAF
jgi:hypothetical protein